MDQDREFLSAVSRVAATDESVFELAPDVGVPVSVESLLSTARATEDLNVDFLEGLALVGDLQLAECLVELQSQGAAVERQELLLAFASDLNH